MKKTSRTAPPETRRKQLIEAAITAIGKYGISGTTLTAVTKEAGLSLGLVNFHFKTKEGLLSETLKFLAQEHRELWMRQAKRHDLTAADKLRAIVDAQFHPRICNRRKLAVWFAFFGEAAYRKSYRAISAEIDMERQEICADLCHDLIEEGGYNGPSPESLATSLEGLFDGLWLNILMYPNRFTRETARGEVMAFLARSFPAHFAQWGDYQTGSDLGG